MRNPIFAVAMIALSSHTAEAQTLSPASTQAADEIEEIVVTGLPSTFGATKSEIPLFEQPRSISVITANEFLDFGALTLSNTLQYTAGVTSNAFGFSTRGDFTNIRGLDAPEYQDNLQVIFGFYNNARVDVYTLEQVEILKGPASVLYGQAAPGGIVSSVSKVADANNRDKEFVFTAGSFDRLQVATDLGFSLAGGDHWSARLVGIYRDSGTQIDYVDDNAVVFAPSITYENDTTKITALYNYSKREGDTSAQFLPLSATGCGTSDVRVSEPNVCANASGREVGHNVYVGDPNFNRYETESYTSTLFATHQFSANLSFEGTARHRDSVAAYDQTWLSFLGDGTPRLLADGTAAARSWSSNPAGSSQFGLDARLRFNFTTGRIDHELLGGVNYQDVETYSKRAFLYAQPTTFNIFNPIYDGSEVPSAAVFDSVRSYTEDSTVATDVYLTDHMSIGDLIVSAGVRISSVESEDAINQQDDDETPITLGALYQTPIGINPYISYAESFRATVGTDVNTNRALKPRKGEQTEVGIKFQNDDGSSYITLAVFQLEENNLVRFVTGNGRTQPGLSIESTGVEIEAKLTLNDFIIDFDLRQQDANDVSETGVETTLPNLADTAGSIWASWQPQAGALAGFSAGLGVRYASENESNGTTFLAANGFAPTPNRVVTDGYALLDAKLGYDFDKVEFALNIRNLTDEAFYATCLSRGDCFAGEQQTVVGTITANF